MSSSSVTSRSAASRPRSWFDIREIELAGGDGPLPWRWRIERIVGEGRLGSPAATVRILGPQRLTYTAAGEERVLRAAASRFSVDVRWAEDRIDSVYADIRGLTVERPRAGAVDRAPHPDPGRAGATAPGSSLTTPASRCPSTRSCCRSSGAGLWVTPSPCCGPKGVSAARSSPRTTCPERWRTGASAADWSPWRRPKYAGVPSTCAARAALFRLDEEFRPAGGFDAQVRGYLITIDAFHAAGLLSQEVMDDVRSLLAFLRDQGRGGGGGAIGLPVRMQDGRVSVGRAQLGGVPSLLPVAD